ncbi:MULTISPECIES: T9SS type A sorting domain-containing protein [unclassified Chryseobacterium]|uniref:T9SS type A sorting domain-containing protein n=1 Tax=unclassified Chryseobacterium TaxID=2593645 RepID=UPI000A5D512C|nr:MULTISPECIES: T9SS type A sorting domain-containing protein [unclassified Chryseobacterium]
METFWAYSWPTQLICLGLLIFHIDYWIEDAPVNVGAVFSPKLSNHGNLPATAGETSAIELGNPVSASQTWVSLDVPLANFSIAGGGSAARDKIYQIILGSSATLDKIYIDNFYFHKNTVLATAEASVKTGVKIYPNPVKAGEMVTLDAKVKSLEIFNMSGQKVKSSEENTVITEGLSKGVYMIKTVTDKGETQSSKLIVK